jgi:hypothetical protein
MTDINRDLHGARTQLLFSVKGGNEKKIFRNMARKQTEVNAEKNRHSSKTFSFPTKQNKTPQGAWFLTECMCA